MTISVLTPVFNTPTEVLRECIESVLSQTYDDWQLILVDDCSTLESVQTVLQEYAYDSRIVVHSRASNGGIVAASNDALARATGEFCALLDHDDLLDERALFEVALAVSNTDDVDYIYTDEDKFDGNGRHFDRFNKPNWSPQRLRAQNYCTHLSVFRTSLLHDIGGFRAGFDGSQDYDLILRASEVARRIVHVPKVLYHWRVIPGSVSHDVEAKPYAYPAALRAVVEHLERVGVAATTVQDANRSIQVLPFITKPTRVHVVIPTRGTRRLIGGVATLLVQQCLQSVFASNPPEFVEIVVTVVANSELSVDDEELIRSIDPERIRLLRHNEPFNFSEHVNRGVLSEVSDAIVVLNDDTVIRTEDWINGLVSPLEEADVAVVGAKLVYPHGRIQSAGHYTDQGVHHAAAGLPADFPGRFSLLTFSCERSSVMFACAAIKTEVFYEVGGLSELFPSSYNDIDFCHKARRAGYRVLWTPHVDVVHFESSSRNPAPAESEKQLLFERWGTSISLSDEYLRVFDFEIFGYDDYGIYEQAPVQFRGLQPRTVPSG